MADIRGLAQLTAESIATVGLGDANGLEIVAPAYQRQPIAMRVDMQGENQAEIMNDSVVAFEAVREPITVGSALLFDQGGAVVLSGALTESRSLAKGDFVFFADGELVVPILAPA